MTKHDSACDSHVTRNDSACDSHVTISIYTVHVFTFNGQLSAQKH